MDIIDQLYNSHVSAATLDTLDKYRIHKDQALHGYHVLKEQLTEDQAAALDQVMNENLNLLTDELEQNFRNGFCLGVRCLGKMCKYAIIYKKLTCQIDGAGQ